LLVLPALPDTIPAHFGLDGSADRFGSKYEMLVLPIITVLMGLFWVLINKTALKDKETGTQNLKVLYWADISVSLLFTALTLWFLRLSYIRAESIYAADTDIDFMKAITVCVSLGYILAGNILPKCKRNHWVGIRVRWTLESEDTWHKTHRFAGRVFTVGGAFSALVCLFLPSGLLPFVFALAVMPLVMVVPAIIYARRVFPGTGGA
jgi:uncharacterized membrane protein